MSFKAEILIGLIILAVAGLVVGIFFSVYTPDKSPVKNLKEELESIQEKEEISNFTTYVPMGQNICEGCHLSGKKFIPQATELIQHKEGGAYCLKCHTIDHDTHPINANVTCEMCHGTKAPLIPEFRNGKIVCEDCHNFPDPLIPSDGNIIVIHRPRNVDCTRCHTDSCFNCHDEIKSNEKWEKRLAHFNALLRTGRG